MLTILAAAGLVAAEPARPECAHDREALLALDFAAFDQTEGNGWRPLHDAGCYLDAAELLRDWQARHADGTVDQRRILLWHEAQMWAFGDRTDLAMPLFERSRRAGDAVYTVSWNSYVDGTMAFLQRHRARLESAIAKLAVLPKPAGWDNAVGVDGKPITMAWPQNLDVLEGLQRCWERPYVEAYVCREIRPLR